MKSLISNQLHCKNLVGCLKQLPFGEQKTQIDMMTILLCVGVGRLLSTATVIYTTLQHVATSKADERIARLHEIHSCPQVDLVLQKRSKMAQNQENRTYPASRPNSIISFPASNDPSPSSHSLGGPCRPGLATGGDTSDAVGIGKANSLLQKIDEHGTFMVDLPVKECIFPI